MKKLDRLKKISRIFGEEYLQPHWPCHTWKMLTVVAGHLKRASIQWGLRVDYCNGSEQGFNLPFLYDGNLEDARKIWDQYGEKLVYIPTQRLPEVRLNAVAIPVGSEHLFIEWNEKERHISQRAMYQNAENVRQGIFGPGSRLYWNGSLRRVFNPRHAAWQRFDKVYRLAFSTEDVDEITFSIAPDGRLVIW